MLESYTAGQDLVLVQRGDYDWAPEAAAHDGAAHLDSVTFRFLGEASTRTGALTSGQVDAIDGVQSIDVPLFDDSPDFTYDRVLNNGLAYGYYFTALGLLLGRVGDDDARFGLFLGSGRRDDNAVSQRFNA